MLLVKVWTKKCTLFWKQKSNEKHFLSIIYFSQNDIHALVEVGLIKNEHGLDRLLGTHRHLLPSEREEDRGSMHRACVVTYDLSPGQEVALYASNIRSWRAAGHGAMWNNEQISRALITPAMKKHPHKSHDVNYANEALIMPANQKHLQKSKVLVIEWI